MAKRLIDANETLGALADIMRELPTPMDHYDNGTYNGLDRAFEIIEQAPTVDAVEVVRCKDCKWYKESKLMPPIKFCFRLIGNDGKPIGYNFSDDDFCSRGERREPNGQPNP